LSDVHTPAQRSYNMSRIRGANTRPEVALWKAVWHMGLRYRLRPRLVGRPDFAFLSAKVAVFVDGCFWHGCHCTSCGHAITRGVGGQKCLRTFSETRW
jgi:DNA mismatch endonuclease (patch repair protein)